MSLSTATVAFATGSWLTPAARALLDEHARTVDEDRVSEADGLYIDAGHPRRLDRAYLDRAPKLRVISSCTVGYENVDVDECTRRGIAFSNSRGSLTESVADIAYLHVIAAFRHAGEAAAWARDGRWLAGPAPIADDLGGSTLGIVGMGAIGMAVAKRARASGMRIVYHNRNRRADDVEVDARYVSFDELLRIANGIVVLTPLTDETRGMFGEAQFSAMSSAYFINASRGALVDTEALYRALLAKTVAGAALDVTDPEPLPPDHPLFALPNVFVTPHIGSATRQTRERMSMYAARNLVEGLAGRPLPQIVNPAFAQKGDASGYATP
jgi:glyoxylate reductase